MQNIIPAFCIFSIAFIQSCGDHYDEIRVCEQCDTLSNVEISFERFHVDDGDTLEIAISKPGTDTNFIVESMSADQDSYILPQLIDTSCTLVISVNGYAHEYKNIHKEWLYMANKFDHTAGKCVLFSYLIDGEVIVNETPMLEFK